MKCVSLKKLKGSEDNKLLTKMKIEKPSIVEVTTTEEATEEEVVEHEQENEEETVETMDDAADDDIGAGGGTVQTISINGQQYQIVSPTPVEALTVAAAAGSASPTSGNVVQYTATTQNGQTIFLPTSAGHQILSLGSGSPPPSSGTAEDATRKREIRLLKNREAARECRNKKKEYIKCLENRVAVLENQNKALIEELKSLKELYTGQKS